MEQSIYKNSKIIKSILLLVIACLGLVAVLFIDNRLHGGFYWDKIQLSDKDFTAYSESVTSDTPLVTNIYFNDEKLIYDFVDNTFYYSVTGEDGYTPFITLADAGASTRDLLLAKSPRVAIYTGETMKLVLYTADSVSVSDLVFTTLPVMNISISAETIDELGLDETYAIYDYAPVSMDLYDNSDDFDGPSRSIHKSAKIHMRGGTTIDAPQKSYRMSLLEDSGKMNSKSKSDLLGLREDDDWILFAAYSDYEKIRTVFCMNLWHDMAAGDNEWNAPVSNEYRFLELFINGRYHGLYALTYPIDDKEFKLKDDETLFKKKDWAGSEYSIDLEYSEYEDGSGGIYILPGYSIQEGDAGSFVQLHNLYFEMAYSGEPEKIRATSDIDNSIDLWLFYKLTQAVDNVYGTGVKNLYSATKNSEDGIDGYKLLFAPWDMDQTFGNRYVDGEGSHGISSYFNAPDYDLPMEWSTVYFLMQSGDPEITSQVRDRYLQLRSGLWSDENISTMISDYDSDIYGSGAFTRTMNRWPDGNYHDPTVGLLDFENYVLARLACMDTYIQSL